MILTQCCGPDGELYAWTAGTETLMFINWSSVCVDVSVCVCVREREREERERESEQEGEPEKEREIYCLIWAPVPCIVLSASVLPLLRSLSISGVRESGRREGSPPLNIPDIHLSQRRLHSIVHSKQDAPSYGSFSRGCWMLLSVVIKTTLVSVPRTLE